MFVNFYKLSKQPFGETPDPRFIYQSRTHREAMASLAYGLSAGRGFLVLSALPGMGKTTLLFRLLEWLRGTSRTVFMFQTQCDSRDLLRFLLTDLGIEPKRNDMTWMYGELKKVLAAEAQAGKRLVLVIDEAQNLKPSVLESVRLLSDFENPTSKLIQIVLAGQPQLANKLARGELAQLRQRISIFSKLVPFTAAETNEYIDHRLVVAGATGRKIFDSQARELIAFYARGIPRNINMLCFNAMSLGFALGKEEIDREVILEAARDFEMFPLAHGASPQQLNHEQPLPEEVQAPEPHRPSTHAESTPAHKPREKPVPEVTSTIDPPALSEQIAAPDEVTQTDAEIKFVDEKALNVEEPAAEEAAQPDAGLTTLFPSRRQKKAASQKRKPHYWQNAVIFACVLTAMVMFGINHLRKVSAKTPIVNATGVQPTKSAPNLDAQPVVDAANGAVSAEAVANSFGKKQVAPKIDVDNTRELRVGSTMVGAPAKGSLPSPTPQESDKAAQVVSSGDFFPIPNPTPLPTIIPEGGVMLHADIGVKAPKLLNKVAPGYPIIAMQRGIQGQVVVDLIVDTTGRPTNPRSIAGPPELQRAAVECVSAWQFQPASFDYKPVPVELVVSVDFTIPSNPAPAVGSAAQ